MKLGILAIGISLAAFIRLLILERAMRRRSLSQAKYRAIEKLCDAEVVCARLEGYLLFLDFKKYSRSHQEILSNRRNGVPGITEGLKSLGKKLEKINLFPHERTVVQRVRDCFYDRNLAQGEDFIDACMSDAILTHKRALIYEESVRLIVEGAVEANLEEKPKQSKSTDEE